MRAFRLLARVAVVLLLALAALLLGADHAEYRQLSRAGLRALGYGVVPLVLVGGLNLHALGAGRAWRVAALAADIVLLVVAVRMLLRSPGAPPWFWLRAGVATLLVVGMAGLLATRPREGSA